MGRSRGALTAKIHALVDADGLPIALKLTEGQAHDGRSAADMLGGLRSGQSLLADRPYDSNASRDMMKAQSGVDLPMPRRVESWRPACSYFATGTPSSGASTS